MKIAVEARLEIFSRLRAHRPEFPLRREMLESRLAVAGAVAGTLGGVVMAVPLILWDWVNDRHSALELPMAVTGWLFGLEHFAQNGYRWWPIVIGALFALAYWLVHGLAFAAMAERFFRIRTALGAAGAGAGFGLAAFVLFWYVVLAIARDGAPFRATADSTLFVAPAWVWIVGFVAFGLTAALVYAGLGRTAARREEPSS